MSYRRPNQYQQQPPPPPPQQQGYQQDQYGQQQYEQPGQNGGYNGQYGQSQYPGQPAYSQYGSGGPVQQSQGGYQSPYASPRPDQTAFGAQAAYPGQQQYSYNPAHYAPAPAPPPPPPRQSSTQSYNPQHYSNTIQTNYGQAYNPQAYSPATAFPTSPVHTASATSGPLDPYGYPDHYAPQPPQTYAQSPQRTNFPPTQQSSVPQPPARQFTQSSNYSPHPTQQYGSYPPPGTAISQPQSSSYSSGGYVQRTSSANTRPGAQQQHSTSSMISTLTDEWRPSPPAYQFDTRQSPSPINHSGSFLPSPPSEGPTPPAHAPARYDSTSRHPTSRPLPGPPGSDSESDMHPGYFQSRPPDHRTHSQQERAAQDELFQQLELELNSSRPGTHSPSISVSQAPYQPPVAQYAPISPGIQQNGSLVNGHLAPAVAQDQQYASDSDPEGAQGLAMLRMDEEDETRRRSSGGEAMRYSSGYGSQRASRVHQEHLLPQPEASDSDDYGTIDMSTFGGGIDPGSFRLSYGGAPEILAAGGAAAPVNGQYSPGQAAGSQHSSMRRSNPSQSSQMSFSDNYAYNYQMDSIHPFPPFNSAARVDAGGTGGLSEPNADGRRQSYDEGDEYTLMESGRFPDEPPDIFYQPPPPGSYRPLPAPPEDGSLPSLQTNLNQTPYPAGPEGFVGYQRDAWGGRSTSLISHTTTPVVHQPLRSKTDAEERKLRAAKLGYASAAETPANLTPAVDLPLLPGRRFVPSQLGAPVFKKCEEPWSMMSILKWLLMVTGPEQGIEPRETEVKEALVALFTHKVPTMNITDAEVLSNKVVADMWAAGTLVATEEWVKIVPGTMQGVIFQLTGSGCYSPTLHDHIVPGRCYSHHCQRTLKKVNLQAQPARTQESWAEFYHLKKEDWENRDKKDLERQYMLHEIVTTEEQYMEQLLVLRTLYRDQLGVAEPSIISPKRRDKFLKDVFGKIDVVKQANEDHLLPQLKYRQQEQGPWVVGFSDIFRQWIRKAKAAYVDYAGAFPGATFMVRQEIDRNIEFRNFIDRARNDKRSSRLGWDSFLKAPITRLQRYTLLLKTVLNTMKVESEEKSNLKIAYEEVRKVTLECDQHVAEMQRKVDLTDLSHKLVLRPGMQNAVELNLDHFGRELIHRGDLQRMGGNRFTWLDSHALLFDHYFVIAKTVAQRAEQGGKLEKYDVSRLPIPMDLLILESENDPPQQKSSYVKGLASVRDVTGRTATPEQAGLGRTPSNQSPGPPQHTNTAASGASLQTVTSISEGKDADRIIYPFRVTHLGRDTYTLFAPTDQVRREWCGKIVEAKTKHAASLYNQNAEPFKLRVMADSAFVYDAFGGSSGKSVVIKGTPVDRAIKEVEQRFKDSGRPGPICRARVNCATSFSTPYPGKQMVAVGTDYGVYISEMDNPRGWSKAISMTRVTQVAVLEEFNVFLLISDKSLIAYHLDVVCPGAVGGPTPANDSAAKAPKKLSGSKDVGFFVMGRMKERTLVLYKKRDSMNQTVFKVLEPVYQKSSEKKRGLMKRGNTEFFRDYDEFYIPTECTAVNLFHSTIAVSTIKGFEVLTLDRKYPVSVPDLRQQHVQNIATHIKDQTALAMLRLSDQEYLLVYEKCAVYVNKHGEVSRSVIMEFVGVAESAALYGAYLILFDKNFIEVRNAQNGRLKQIIAGKEIKCLDDGGSWSAASAQGTNGVANGTAVSGRTVKLVMQHPDMEKTQVVAELLLNENLKDETGGL